MPGDKRRSAEEKNHRKDAAVRRRKPAESSGQKPESPVAVQTIINSMSVLDAVADGISIQNRDFRILYQNAAHKQLIGEHAGKLCYEAYEQSEHVCEPCPVAMSFSDGLSHTIERRVEKPDRLIEVEIMASPLCDDKGMVVAVIESVRNIARRKRIEEALQEQIELVSRSQREWMSTFDAIQDLIYICDEHRTIIRGNRAFSDFLGLQPHEVIGLKCSNVFDDALHHRPDCPLFVCSTTGSQMTSEITDPKSGKTFLLSTFPASLSDSLHGGIICIAKDVSEQRRREMKLIMNERLAALGEMAASIAHEINNPLASISGCAENLLRRLKDNRFDAALFSTYLGIIEEEILRCKNITTSMLAFVRRESLTLTGLNVRDSIEKAIELLTIQNRMGGISVRETYAKELPMIQGNEEDLRQVIIALLTNSLDAMNDTGALEIETSLQDSKVIITISDTGPGIAPDLAQKIFEPFFTTKMSSGGTGLGLSIARKLIDNHKGSIEVIAGNRKGATFKISFPL